MRKLETLITASRRATENQEFSSSAGISDEEFIQYFNDAQEEIQNLINLNFPKVFMKVADLQVPAQDGSTLSGIALPSDCYLGTRIDTILFSDTGRLQDAYRLKKGSTKEYLGGNASNPSYYFRASSDIFLQPYAQSGGVLYVAYQAALPKLDIIRGIVSSVTLGTNTITSLVLDPTQVFDFEAIQENRYVSVGDKDGNIKMTRIPVDAIDSSTGVVTVDPSFTFEAGETIAAGDFIFCGKVATNFSQLPETCERYLLEYCNARILMRDSSSDAQDISQVLLKIEAGIKSAFAETESDPDYVAVLDNQYLGWDV